MRIINGRVIDPKNGIDGMGDVVIREGKITAIYLQDSPMKTDDASKEVGANTTESVSATARATETVVDAKGAWVIPGLIDLHVHLREPGFEYKETIETGAESAAKGGVTTLCAMPNTKPATDSKDIVTRILQKAEHAKSRVFPIGAITKGQEGKELADFEAMVKAGICAISEDGKSVMDKELLREAMIQAKALNIPVMSHCEDHSMEHGHMHEGAKSQALGIAGIPRAMEDNIAARDIQINHEVGGHLHLCHVSTYSSVDLLRQAKKEGKKVTAEVCPHHFSLTDSAIDGTDGNYKMNPPLREEQDIKALVEGLRDGTIDAIATDHAPHHVSEKTGSFDTIANGIIGLETLLSVSYTYLVGKYNIEPTTMIQAMTVNPAEIIGLNRGHLSIGAAADVTLFDPTRRYVYEEGDIVSKSKNSPYIGMELQGKVIMTLRDGMIMYEEREKAHD